MKTGAMFLISNNMFLVCRVCFIETSKERESAATSSAAAYKKYGVWCVCVFILHSCREWGRLKYIYV